MTTKHKTHPLSAYADGMHFENFAAFGRAVYKYTDCGPWVAAVLPNGNEVYYADLNGLKLKMSTRVVAVKVGSIVEGSDACIGPYRVTDPADFEATLQQVSAEANEAWHEANDEANEEGEP